MARSRTKTFLAALAISGGLWVGIPRVSAHEGPGVHDPVAAIKAGQEMAQAANNLWAALSPEQQQKAGFEFKDEERVNWHFIPRVRKGLPWKEMAPAQRELGHALLASGLGQKGYVKAETIMSLEAILAEMEKGQAGKPLRDPEMYFFSVFGKPGAKDGKEPWGWRVEGHHLSLNFTVAGDKGIAGGPIFMGTNPGEVREGPRKGLRVLGTEEDLGRQLVKSLTDDQKKKAIIPGDAPKEVITGNQRKVKPLEPAGLGVPDMNDEQKQLLRTLVHEYAFRVRDELAVQDLDKIKQAGVDKVTFAWAGGLERGQPHYYRIQGPTFLIEYDNTQNDANHAHTVWRDFNNDFGDDVLARHYELEHRDDVKTAKAEK